VSCILPPPLLPLQDQSIAGQQALSRLSSYRNVAPELAEALRDQPAVEVILTVKGIAGSLPFYRPVIDDPPERRRSAFMEVLGTLESRPDDELVELIRGYPDLGVGHLRVNARGAERLARHPLTYALSTNASVRPLLANAVAIANLDVLHAQGLAGQGTKVAVVEAGGFSPAGYAEEHCFCTSSAGQPCCPGPTHEAHGPGAAVANVPVSDSGHATMVASVLASGSTGSAPSTGVVAVATGLSPSSLTAALNYLISRPDIGVINLSLLSGSDGHKGNCDADPAENVLLGPLSALHSGNRVIVASAGNYGRSNMIVSPACLSPTIAVSGTWACTYDNSLPKLCPGADALMDKLWIDTDSSPMTDLAAPAAWIALTHPAYGPGLKSGTSYSAPLVAGCAAVLRQAHPGASNETIRTALRTSSTYSTRPGHGTFPRLDCAAALAWLNASGGTPLNQRGITGNWYNPSTGGQGFSIEVFPDSISPGQGQLFAGWFTFDTVPGDASKNRWYTLAGTVGNSNSATLSIRTGWPGNFNALPIVDSEAVGTATLHLTNCNEALLDYEFDDEGPEGTIPLHRLTANVDCTGTGSSGAAHSDYFLSGNWYNPSTAGQGLIIELNPVNPVLFATWFTFAPNGAPNGGVDSQRWYTLQLDPGDYALGQREFVDVPIGETIGGKFDDAQPEPETQQVGVATLEFVSCTLATLSYEFDETNGGTNQGLTGGMTLFRTSGVAPAGCVD
jgi:hypothetical protein